MLFRLPGGLCFAHGPYTEGDHCPQWPKCLSDPQQQQWLDLSFRQKKRTALLRAAEELELNGLLPTTVVQLRIAADGYKEVEASGPTKETP